MQMNVLKIKLYQEAACYTKPFAYKVGETYPLPPYSTVIGMLHRVLNATSYHPMKISVQGEYRDKFVDYRTSYLYKGKSTTQSPLNIHLLYGVTLIFHVHADEEILERIETSICRESFLSLGRKEDLVRIDDVKRVGVQFEEQDDLYTLRYDMYVPIKQLEEETLGIRYRINTTYKSLNQQRIWDKVDVVYLTAGDELGEEKYLFDDEGDLVYFHTPL
jgi:CRISPR-associated protein Cas5t